jgi:hypothetical protein
VKRPSLSFGVVALIEDAIALRRLPDVLRGPCAALDREFGRNLTIHAVR